MPFGVRHSSAAQTNINRARARDSGLCTASQPVAFCSLAVNLSLPFTGLVGQQKTFSPATRFATTTGRKDTWTAQTTGQAGVTQKEKSISSPIPVLICSTATSAPTSRARALKQKARILK